MDGYCVRMGVFLSPELTSLKILTIFHGASLYSSRNLHIEYTFNIQY